MQAACRAQQYKVIEVAKENMMFSAYFWHTFEAHKTPEAFKSSRRPGTLDLSPRCSPARASNRTRCHPRVCPWASTAASHPET